MTTGADRFAFRFTGANKLMVLLGLTPRTCFVEVSAERLDVRFGWAFRARVPRSSITSVVDDTAPVYGWGAHGWRHVWLVNGTSKDLLRMTLDPMARGHVVGVPVRIRVLRIGIDDRDGFRAAIS